MEDDPRGRRKTDGELWKRYATARDMFARRRGAHFATLDAARKQAQSQKEALVSAAEELSGSSEWADTAARLKELMAEWKAAPRASKEVEQRLWERFRAAQDAFRPPGEPLRKGCEKLLEHVCREWEAQPRHRDPVFARDGWRCAVPACTSRAHLHDHHILYRSAGGDNSRANRVAICAWHHLRGIHLGRIRAHGTAPHAITWEIGVRRGRPPLLRTLGDRYLP